MARTFEEIVAQQEIIWSLEARGVTDRAVLGEGISMVSPNMTHRQFEAVADYLAGPVRPRR